MLKLSVHMSTCLNKLCKFLSSFLICGFPFVLGGQRVLLFKNARGSRMRRGKKTTFVQALFKFRWPAIERTVALFEPTCPLIS